MFSYFNSHDAIKNSTTDADRLIQFGDSDFDYDEFGNQIRETGKGIKTLREYNAFNQLSSFNNNGTLTQYDYDPLGRRIAKHTEHGKIDYIWDNDQLIGECQNGEYTWYINLPNQFHPVALIKKGEVYYYHLDQLNTPRFVTNNKAEVVWENQADVYGYEEPEAEPNTNKEHSFTQPIRFQGQYLDEESGLHYNRYRYYSPKQQRFINQDLIGLVGGINHYQYAPNPVNWVDPFGLLCKEGQRRVAKAISNNEYISDELRAKLIALSTTSIYTADSMVNAIENGNAADLVKTNELDKAKTTLDDGFNSKQKSIISNLKDKYPNAIPIDVNPEKTNAGKGSPRFHTWLKKDGVVLYDAESNSYIYAIEMDTSLFGRKVVDIEYKADQKNPEMRYPDFDEYSVDKVALPNGVAIPENRAKDYGDMYEALDKKHDKQSYSKEKYGVPVLQKNGLYKRNGANNPQIKDNGLPLYTPHHHQNKTDMLMTDYRVHDVFKHYGGVSAANS